MWIWIWIFGAENKEKREVFIAVLVVICSYCKVCKITCLCWKLYKRIENIRGHYELVEKDYLWWLFLLHKEYLMRGYYVKVCFLATASQKKGQLWFD